MSLCHVYNMSVARDHKGRRPLKCRCNSGVPPLDAHWPAIRGKQGPPVYHTSTLTSVAAAARLLGMDRSETCPACNMYLDRGVCKPCFILSMRRVAGLNIYEPLPSNWPSLIFYEDEV